MRFFRYQDQEGYLHFLNPQKARRIVIDDKEETITFIFNADEVFHCIYKGLVAGKVSNYYFINAKSTLEEILKESNSN